MTRTPTNSQFAAYQGAFDYFNKRLFSGMLPPLMLNFSRKARAMGFYAPERWRKRSKKTATVPEISLNPDCLDHGSKEALSTLVHEMCHHWQFEFGKPSRSTYHNREWAGKMLEVGLHPSDTGKPGGKMTGQRMSDYVVTGGPFDKAMAAMPKSVMLPWVSGALPKKVKEENAKKRKVCYVCGECGAKAWGKPELHIICADCEQAMERAT